MQKPVFCHKSRDLDDLANIFGNQKMLYIDGLGLWRHQTWDFFTVNLLIGKKANREIIFCMET